jgi:hypothetical protein
VCAVARCTSAIIGAEKSRKGRAEKGTSLILAKWGGLMNVINEEEREISDVPFSAPIPARRPTPGL